MNLYVFKFIIISLLCISVQGSFAFSTKGLTSDWKVLVYMQADNNLSPYAFWDLAEMEKAGQADIPVIVELDLPGNSGIKRLKIESNKSLPALSTIDFNSWSLSNLNSKVIEEFPENKFSQDERLMNFLIGAEERYPTEHTLLVIWGHGEGFGYNLVAQFGGVAVDDNPRSKLSINSVSDSLRVYKTIFNKKIDILSMDACLMQTLEVAAELRGSVDYLIGSTQIQDFRGLPYDSVLSYIGNELNDEAGNSGSQSYSLARKIPELFERRALAEVGSDKRTMSSINLSELENELVPSLNTTASLLLDYLQEDPFNKLDILDLIDDIPFFLGESRDVSALFSRLDKFFYDQDRFEISQQLRETMQAMHQTSLAYFYGNSYVLDNRIHLGSFKAFGLWLPSKLEYYALRHNDFARSTLFRITPSWAKLLSKLYSPDLF